MSDMSQAQGPPGGDPLDLVNATGTEDDVMPGPGVNLDEVDDSDDASGRTMEVDSDPAPEGGATLDPPDSEITDEDPGTSDLESGADPMPDMSGTTPS